MCWRGIIYTYHRNTKVTSITSYTYTKEGLLKTVTDGISGTVLTNTYDAVGNKTKEVEKDKDGNKLSEIHYEYDQAGNVTKQTQVNLEEGATKEDNLTVESKYYPNGALNYVIDTAGVKTTYGYDKSWRVQTIVSETEPTVTYKYDPAGRVLSETIGGASDELVTTSYTYDIYGNVKTMTEPGGQVTSYRYDNNGNLIETEDATGRVFYSKYDALNRVVESGMRKPDGKEEDNIVLSTMSYNITDHTITQTDAVNGGSVITYYDAAGRAYKTTDDAGYVLAETIYDTEGRILQTVDANGLVSENIYNTFMQIEKVKTGAKGTKKADGTYALTGDVRETDYSYDDLGRTTKVTEYVDTETESGVTTEPVISSVVYDGLGRIKSLKDPNQNASESPVNTYTYEYNEQGLLAKETNSIGNVTEYQYNAKLLLETLKDSAGEETKYSYDSLNRVTSVKDELGTISYTYDESGNITDVKEVKSWVDDLFGNESTIHREFDSLNRVTEYTDSNNKTVKYGYDQLGNMVSLTYPGGEIVTYTYRDDGSIATMTSKSGGTIYTWGYDYDRYGRLTEITRPDGSVETRSYNDAGQLTGQVDKNKAGGILQEISYTYNVFGEVVQKDTSYQGDLSTLESVKMSYDDANRLVSYNGQDVTYDAKGNMVHGPVDGVMQDLTYDCRNRLVSAGGITYSYDAENNRTATTENEKTTTYVHDVSGSLSKLLIAYEADGSETSYYYGAEGLAGQYSTGTKESFYYHYDNIGSTTCVTNAIGAIVEQIAYGTYGELLTTVKNNIRFLYNGAYGVATDSNGLYYMRARYYNPDIKRFINQDIKVGDISNGQGLNRYAYCEGNPVSLIDPFGLSPSTGNGDLFTELLSCGVHFLLGLGGMVPVYGIIFDLADAALCYFENDKVGAVLSLACAIPFAGLVTGAGKLGKNALRFTGLLTDVIKNSDMIRVTASIMVDAANNARKLLHSGVADITSFVIAKGDDAAKFLQKGADGFKEVAGIVKQKGQKIYTSAKNATQKLKKTLPPWNGKNINKGGTSSVLENANYAQKTYSNTFSPEGIKKYSDLAGEPINTIDDLVSAINNGKINVSDLPIEYIMRDGNTLILNTRTSQALTQAGIPRSQWVAIDRTGNQLFEQLLDGQLSRNKLTSEGISTVRPGGKK